MTPSALPSATVLEDSTVLRAVCAAVELANETTTDSWTLEPMILEQSGKWRPSAYLLRGGNGGGARVHTVAVATGGMPNGRSGNLPDGRL